MRSVLRWSTLASFGTLAVRLLFLGAYCVAEALANPGYSLVDGYWRGRLPWMGIAEGLIVTGATVSAITGWATVLWVGGWWRRALALPLLLPIALWWFIGIVGLPGEALASRLPAPAADRSLGGRLLSARDCALVPHPAQRAARAAGPGGAPDPRTVPDLRRYISPSKAGCGSRREWSVR